MNTTILWLITNVAPFAFDCVKEWHKKKQARENKAEDNNNTEKTDIFKQKYV